ncbi:uracil phosphoribosyltransferase [Marivirga tractuosa]|uniref:Uracil phosphoribosyltransferase n=1 Tax=Marivirga tractuosa (strain ATCC 23168 / DSM 4126 / NBRC 15989 / NCIMB 1408 / VKM B-1430 / H-43) TaxID=643867 RepID=E4TT90_MARTH|nr:uracil phosphoribosyltransferase [Marivirga tractuosa]ADR21920.1 uracil phosphoribosyltransferase [Marivirga tractuosa DSM 4126]BDD13621.1 uracil phosphoribosyltransferase [Marivirga tractuosa]
MYILDKENSIANHFLAELREVDIQKDRYRFRRNLERVAEILAYEISKSLYFQYKEIQTPLEKTSVALMHDFPVIVSVLRAGLPFHQGFLNIFDHSDSGFIGAYRKHIDDNNFTIEMGYEALPPLDGRSLILADPMLATGQSIVKAIDHITQIAKPEKIIIAAAIGTPEGVGYIDKNLNQSYELYLGSLDRELNEKAYILPGLGDAGDLSYGPKHTH